VSDIENLDYYDLLGVSRSASHDEIKRAYRREISKYHPDRFVNATPEEQAYASLRSQRLTEAYGVLSDFAARNAYNRGQHSNTGARPPRPSAPPQQRDHQAELYEQALDHLNAGRTLQAIGALRQLQQINPFYRDSAELLGAAEAQLNQRPAQPRGRGLRPLLLAGGAVASLALVIAVAAWALSARGAGVSQVPTSSSAATGASAPPTAAPEPTGAPAEPTAAPVGSAPTEAPAEPTAEPTAAPAPTEPPTAEPTAEPTAAPAPTEPPTAAPENGTLLLSDNFSSAGWASISGPSWQVGYQNRRYRISSDAGSGPIWSYRAAPAKDVSIGVDIQVTSGEAGMLVRFLDANNYLGVVINPSQTSYRIEQHSGGATNVLAGGQSEAINLGAEAINRLVIRVRGDHIQVLANGTQLAEADASAAPDTARYGLLIIARDTAAEAFFDNLEIRALP
jgi:hypothetical protein